MSNEFYPYPPAKASLSDGPSLGETIRQEMAKQVEVDLPQLVGFLGELCEVRLPIYQTSSAVFANEVREDSIEYGEPVLQRILLMPLADPALVTSDGLALPLDPIRAIIQAEECPPERAMITVRREIDRHFYVLRRESLTKTPPITHQLYLVPIDLEEGLLEGENFVERDVVQNESDDSLASILANDDDGTTGGSSS